MASSLTKFPGIVKNLFLLRLVTTTKIFKSGNAWGFAIEFSSDDWMYIREVEVHCEFANVIWSFSLYVVIWDNNEETFWMLSTTHFPIVSLFLSIISLFKVSNGNTRTSWEVRSKLTVKTPDRQHWRCSCIFIVNFEQISCLVLFFLLLALRRYGGMDGIVKLSFPRFTIPSNLK